MKKILVLSLVLFSLTLTACTKDRSLGTIGGSDGPVSVIVSGEKKGADKRPIRMIKAGGKLYYDSGRTSDIASRCGTFDGELVKAGKIYEIPRNDNECNFDGALGYQNATDTTKEVSVGGEWVIFKLFDDPELDMDIFKYCFYIRGSMPNAAKESELVVLTDNIEYDFDEYKKLADSKLDTSERVYHSSFRTYGE